MDLKIGDYLENYNKTNKNGECKSCKKLVKWSSTSLQGHKRASCSEDGKKLFFDRFPQWRVAKYANSWSNLSLNASSNSSSSFSELYDEQLNRSEFVSSQDVDSSIADAVFKKGK